MIDKRSPLLERFFHYFSYFMLLALEAPLALCRHARPLNAVCRPRRDARPRTPHPPTTMPSHVNHRTNMSDVQHTHTRLLTPFDAAQMREAPCEDAAECAIDEMLMPVFC